MNDIDFSIDSVLELIKSLIQGVNRLYHIKLYFLTDLSKETKSDSYLFVSGTYYCYCTIGYEMLGGDRRGEL
jgi:hypothetical protein